MADEYSHINYSIADIEKYLSGRMTAKEMHDLERAALSDPFLADAIEGYREADISQSYKHLDEISAMLRQDKNETKVIPILVRKNGWWRIAASVILLAGIGTISWLLIKENNSATGLAVAQEKRQPAQSADTVANEQKTEPPVIAKNEVIRQAQKNKEVAAEREQRAKLARAEANAAKKEELKAAKVARDEEAVAARADLLEEKTKSDTIKEISPAISNGSKALRNVTSGTQRGFAAPLKTYVFKGKVSDENHLPVPNATIAFTNTKAGTVTDMDGNFAIVSQDSTAMVSVSSIGYADKNVLLKQDSNNAITISESGESLAETVVMDYVSRKMKKTDSLASPVTGWESFDKYVAEKMKKKYDSTASMSDLNGDVMIEFLVDNKGKPYSFKVLKSLNGDADKIAVDIIKGGPAWTSDKKRKKGKVTIHF
ncbi:carboxypeptidase-like regulatory domain-containing protein [Danxiaibacter flavus]|uniref:Carboxypeptidase-like regulatory domain-containing protein n=1 Tax=Danxiaibacter flavus TaxID=3049108 RepID=A0ABV3ZQF2_9BACT|nr:carboxypeptidase-like regulatory domain-containing protein [Chitinophagaceae bacterium DXS]